MRSKLLVVAIAAGLGFSTFVSAAPATKTTKASTTSATTNAEIEMLKAQLAAMQSKIDELEQRTDAQSDINVSTGQAIEKVQASATNDKTLAKLEKLVNNTTIGGKMYVDFTNIDQKNSDTGKTAASGTGLDVKRFYLSVTHNFDDIWSANLTTDFNYVGSDGETNLFVKKAYVQGKFDQAAVLRLGSADMPWIPFVENYYGFRYVENTLTDRLKYANSADWGIHLGGDIGESKSVNYAVSVVNGNGYKNPSRSKGVDVEGRVGFVPFENTIVAVGGYSGKLGKDVQGVPSTNTATRGDVLIAYASKQFRVGAEYFTAKNWNNVLTPFTDKADGYSVWGSVAVADGVNLFARYDNAKLSKDRDHDAKDSYYNAGVEFQITKGFKLAGVWKHEKADKTVGTPVPPHVQNVKTNEIGVFGEVAF
ncbi:carbohydrate porin [Dyella ginsengisoli]|uniref:Carbohydrate porin n=1 Tax=Dyella ginsengisoli TaxID=363848 RepID=A0ABW8JVV0_9GAMM